MLEASGTNLSSKPELMIDAAINSGKDLAGPDLKKYHEVTKQLDEVQARIDRHEANLPRLDDRHMGPVFQPSTPVAARSTGMKSHLREIYNRATVGEREQIDSLAAYLTGGDIRATADLKPSGAGGYIIPSVIVPALERDYTSFSPVASVARLWSTETGEDAVFPVLSDSEAAVQLDSAAATGADATVSGDVPPTAITGPTLTAWKVSSKPVFIPRETFTDSPIDIIGEVVGALLARIIRFENCEVHEGRGHD